MHGCLEPKMLILRTTLKPTLLKKTLFKGTFLAASGILIILLAGILLPLSLLKIFGAPAFFIGLLLAALGLIPYRKLTRLELFPQKLHFDGASLVLLHQGKPILKIPKECVDRVFYFEEENIYGIGFIFKKPCAEKVQIFDERYTFYLPFSSKKTCPACDLFLPYFSDASCQELNNAIFI